MRIIDADRVLEEIRKKLAVKSLAAKYLLLSERAIIEKILYAPTIETKQVKYYDEDEQVWKIGEVIVNSSEKPNNSND